MPLSAILKSPEIMRIHTVTLYTEKNIFGGANSVSPPPVSPVLQQNEVQKGSVQRGNLSHFLSFFFY